MADSDTKIEWLFEFINKYKEETLSIWYELYHFRRKKSYTINNNKLSYTLVGNRHTINQLFNCLLIDKDNSVIKQNLELLNWYDFNFVPTQYLSEVNVERPIVFVDEVLSFELEYYISSGNVLAIVLDNAEYNDHVEDNYEGVKVYSVKSAKAQIDNILFGAKSEKYDLNKTGKISHIPRDVSPNFRMISSNIIESSDIKKADELFEAAKQEIARTINKLWLQNDIEALKLVEYIFPSTGMLIEKVQTKSESLNREEIEGAIIEWLKHLKQHYSN